MTTDTSDTARFVQLATLDDMTQYGSLKWTDRPAIQIEAASLKKAGEWAGQQLERYEEALQEAPKKATAKAARIHGEMMEQEKAYWLNETNVYDEELTRLGELREAAVRANAALGWAVDDMNGNTSPSWMAFEEKYGKGPGAADEAYSACVALRDLLTPTVAQGGGAI